MPGFSKSRGLILHSLSSTRLAAAEPSPWPDSPWQVMQANFVKSALPSARAGSVRAGGVPKLTTERRSSLVLEKRGEKVLMYSTTAQRSLSLSITFHGGMGVPGMPKETARNKSTSVGRLFGAVDLSRKLAWTKLRGFGSRKAAASPLP